MELRRERSRQHPKRRKAVYCDPALYRVGRSPPPSGVGGLAATVAVPYVSTHDSYFLVGAITTMILLSQCPMSAHMTPTGLFT